MKTVKIIKIGGNLIDDANALSDFLSGFAKISGPKILVHGGGKLASRLAEKMNIEVKMIDGRRITNKESLEVIIMVYAGTVNKKIIAELQKNGCNAVGLTGADGNSIISVKRPVGDIDYGYVGDIVEVNTDMLQLLLSNGVIPVLCPITHDENGQLFNTNADTIASQLAIKFAESVTTELYYCFEKNGVLRDIHDDASVIEALSISDLDHLKKNGVISDGMLPKLENCIQALEKNVEKVCIGKPEMLFQTQSKHTTLIK